MRVRRKNKYKIKSRPVTKSISSKLDKVIKQKQRELQRQENIEYGRKAQNVNYQFVSDFIAEMLGGGK